MEWCGGSHDGQDVCIRLVQSCSNDNEPENAVLALVFVHSNILSSYIRGMAERFAQANPSPIPDLHELIYITLHVDRDDVQLYIDCFTVMNDYGWRYSFSYNPLETGVEGLRYTLRLLGAASHIDYHPLMLSITSHLISINWSSDENLIVLRETRMRKEGFRYLIKRCCYHLGDISMCLILQLLKTTRVEGWRPFEQEVVAMVHEDLNRLLVEAHNVCDGERSTEGLNGLPDKLMNICRILMKLMGAQFASQGVKWLLQYPSIPKFLGSLTGSCEQRVGFFKITMVFIYNQVVAKHVILGNSDRYTLLKDWTRYLEGYEKHKVRRGLGSQYKRAKEAIFGSLSSKQKIELVHMTAEYGYYFVFGKPEKLLKALKNSMGARDE